MSYSSLALNRHRTINKSKSTRTSSSEPAPGSDLEAFERAWALYPKRAGGNSKKAARDKWLARTRSGICTEELLAGVRRYAHFVHATGKEGTEFVKQAKTFFGPDEYWKEDWVVPGERPRGRFVG